MKTMNKTALITGAATRVGKELALSLAAEGYDIALHYHHSKEKAEAVQQAIIALGRACTLHCYDLASPETPALLINELKEFHQNPEVLINNAAIFDDSEFDHTNPELFDHYINVNAKAPFFLMQTWAKELGLGSIINILDSYIVRNSSRFFTYLLSKKMLHDITLMAAEELAPKITVNGIAPGILLPSLDLDEAYIEQRKEIIPMKKIAEIKDLCQACKMLIQNQSITGQVIHVDAGEHLL